MRKGQTEDDSGQKRKGRRDPRSGRGKRSEQKDGASEHLFQFTQRSDGLTRTLAWCGCRRPANRQSAERRDRQRRKLRSALVRQRHSSLSRVPRPAPCCRRSTPVCPTARESLPPEPLTARRQAALASSSPCPWD